MAATALNSLFQVGLDVRDRDCLVIGGGGEAEDKTGRLLDAGARILLVSPDMTPALADYVHSGQIRARRRRYKPWDLDGAFLVMNTVRGNLGLAEQVFAAAESRGIIVNTYDDLARSHFGMAALVRAGPLRISISSSNASPTLSSRLRQDLEELFDEEFGQYVKELGRARALLKERIPDFATRRQILRGLVEGVSLQGHLHLPEDWRQRIESALEQAPDTESGTKKPGESRVSSKTDDGG